MNPLRNESARMPETEHGTIAAYFRNPSDGEKAVSELSSAGFSKKDIGVAIRDRDTGSEKNTSTAGGWGQRLRSMFSQEERDEYYSHDALDVLDHMGVPEKEGLYYKNALRQGGVLVTVNAAGRTQQALSILKRCNGITSENFNAQEFSRNDIPETKDIGEHHIQLIGETLRVNKERVQRGAVTLKKEVVTERQNVEVPVTREELVIERRPADGREATGTNFEDGKEIKVPLTEERVNVEKRPVVREEVAVGKRQVQDTKNVSDDVRHEEFKVDKEGDVPLDSTKVRKRA